MKANQSLNRLPLRLFQLLCSKNRQINHCYKLDLRLKQLLKQLLYYRYIAFTLPLYYRYTTATLPLSSLYLFAI